MLRLNLSPCREIAPRCAYAADLKARRDAEAAGYEARWIVIREGFEGYCRAVVAGMVKAAQGGGEESGMLTPLKDVTSQAEDVCFDITRVVELLELFHAQVAPDSSSTISYWKRREEAMNVGERLLEFVPLLRVILDIAYDANGRAKQMIDTLYENKRHGC